MRIATVGTVLDPRGLVADRWVTLAIGDAYQQRYVYNRHKILADGTRVDFPPVVVSVDHKGLVVEDLVVRDSDVIDAIEAAILAREYWVVPGILFGAYPELNNKHR